MTYRYHLARHLPRVLATRGALVWVMLNPSTADDHIDDPTIRRCIGFARTHNYERIDVVNLFAARATNPADLATIDDPVGPENNNTIDRAFALGNTVAFAWGAHKHPLIAARIEYVTDAAARFQHTPQCLGRTGNGSPRHPLYVAGHQPLIPWSPT